jgi:small subunit ribosomal protein S6
MRHYEVTFIVDPTLSSDEVNATAKKYADMLTGAGYSIVHTDEIGLRQLAYEIKKRHSGLYFCIEFAGADGQIINKLELTLRRDDKILRFLTVALDKYGVQYNQDKRDGKIGKRKAAEAAARAKKDNPNVEENVEEVVAVG